MGRSSRGARRGNYESLNNEIPDDTPNTHTNTNPTSKGSRYESTRFASRGKDDDLDLLSSSDENDNEDVELLPLKVKDDTLRAPGARSAPAPGPGAGPTSRSRGLLETDGGSSSSSTLPVENQHNENEDEVAVPKEQRDVGKRIENFLETERRNLLAESFRTDIEDANTDFVLSEDEDEYGVPMKGRGGEREADKEGEGGRWKQVAGVLFGKTWWHIGFYFIAAILLIWGALRGLTWMRGEKGREFVSFFSSLC